MAITAKQLTDGTFRFHGRANDITRQKNKALEPFGKQVLNYGLVLRLLTTQEQAQALNQQIGNARFVRNRYLEERNNIVLTDNKALFGSRDKNRISVSAVHRLVKKHLLESGLDASQFSAHKLRHTAATLMLANGVDLKTLQEVLGHENLNTTQIYTHIENTDKKIAAEANPLSKFK